MLVTLNKRTSVKIETHCGKWQKGKGQGETGSDNKGGEGSTIRKP